MKNLKTLTFGEIICDINGERRFIGGAPFNFACHLSLLGAESYLLSSVGNDEIGRESLEKLNKFNVHTDYVTTDNQHESGKCLLSLDKSGHPTFKLLENQCYDYLPNISLKDKNFDLLYFGSLTLRSKSNLSLLRQIIEECNFNHIVVDVNIRPPFYSKEVLNFCLSKCDILKISEEELEKVLSSLELNSLLNLEINETIKRICEEFNNVKIFILTKGEYGSILYNADENEFIECPIYEVKVDSTVGAGDSYIAGFTYFYLKNYDLKSCMSNAARLSGYVVSKYEAMPFYKFEDLF